MRLIGTLVCSVGDSRLHKSPDWEKTRQASQV
jgi:hypothetical protein